MPIKGVWAVPKKLSNGQTRVYYYLNRHGGPCFWSSDDGPLDGRRLPPDFVAAYEAAQATRHGPSKGSFGRAVLEYEQRSAKFKRMSMRGQAARSNYLDRWRSMKLKNGHSADTAPLAVFDQRGIIKYITKYRDETWGHSPSGADEAVFALSAFLRWAKSEGRLDWNRCEGIPGLYERPTEARIWSEQEQTEFLADAPWAVVHFFKLALFTGLRLSDLVKLPVTACKREHIIIPTGKSRGRNTAIVPIVPPLRELIEAIDARRAKLKAAPTTLLFNSYGKPWTADGLASSFYRQRRGSMSGDGLPSIHDLRKTAATNMVLTQQRFPDVITDQVLCDMFGWTLGTLSQMKRIYVSDGAVIAAITEKRD
ncbi:MAG: tyrosine-type recombinase/integrase [Pseudomonadota bacterium]